MRHNFCLEGIYHSVVSHAHTLIHAHVPMQAPTYTHKQTEIVLCYSDKSAVIKLCQRIMGAMRMTLDLARRLMEDLLIVSLE